MARIGIAGAGVLGRLLAWRLASLGHAVSVFDPAPGLQAPAVGQGSVQAGTWVNPSTGSGPSTSSGRSEYGPSTGSGPSTSSGRSEYSPSTSSGRKGGVGSLARPEPISVRSAPIPVRAEPAEALTHAPAHAAGFTAAGMLSPIAELDNADPAIARLGWRSLPLWQAIGAALGGAEPLVRVNGSLLLAHGSDRGAAQRVLARLGAIAEAPQAEDLSADALRALEPAIAPGLQAWHLPGEGQVLPRETLVALAVQAPCVRWHWLTPIDSVLPGRLVAHDGTSHTFDIAIDTRGLGARPQVTLRGVRGELIWLHAPGVVLQRPLRLLHPRHRVYLVPRPGGRIVVGASEIESEDWSPPSLRSVVELLSAAHSVLPELAEARIDHMETNLRPARQDNAPCIEHAPGLLRINGLFRHGWLMAPALVDDAMAAAGLITPQDKPHEAAHA